MRQCIVETARVVRVVRTLASLSGVLGCVSEPAVEQSEPPDASAFFDADGGPLKPPVGPGLRPRDQMGAIHSWQDADSQDGGSRGSGDDSSGSGAARGRADAGRDDGPAPRWIEAPESADAGAPESEGAAEVPSDAGDAAMADPAQTQTQTIGADEPREPEAPAEDAGPPLPPSAAAVAVGALVISEWMADPKGISDAEGEWIELFNASAEPVELTDCAVGDGTDQAKLEPAATLAPGAYASVARARGAPGFTPDLTAAFSLTNSADRIEVVCGGVVIDRIAYDKAQGWMMRAGVASALDPASLTARDNDAPESWCLATEAYASDLGTPGVPNAPCVSSDEAEPAAADGEGAAAEEADAAVETEAADAAVETEAADAAVETEAADAAVAETEAADAAVVETEAADAAVDEVADGGVETEPSNDGLSPFLAPVTPWMGRGLRMRLRSVLIES